MTCRRGQLWRSTEIQTSFNALSVNHKVTIIVTDYDNISRLIHNNITHKTERIKKGRTINVRLFKTSYVNLCFVYFQYFMHYILRCLCYFTTMWKFSSTIETWIFVVQRLVTSQWIQHLVGLTLRSNVVGSDRSLAWYCHFTHILQTGDIRTMIAIRSGLKAWPQWKPSELQRPIILFRHLTSYQVDCPGNNLDSSKVRVILVNGTPMCIM